MAALPGNGEEGRQLFLNNPSPLHLARASELKGLHVLAGGYVSQTGHCPRNAHRDGEVDDHLETRENAEVWDIPGGQQNLARSGNIRRAIFDRADGPFVRELRDRIRFYWHPDHLRKIVGYEGQQAPVGDGAKELDNFRLVRLVVIGG